MRIIKIDPFDNGAHANQIGHLDVVPDGWAVIPDAMLCENFPFGDVEVEEIDGVVTVTKWTPGTIPVNPVDLELIRSKKEEEISSACNVAIIHGVDVETTQGTEHFSLEETDQINLTTALSAVQQGATEYPYHADGCLCRMFSAEEIQAVANASVQHKLYHTTLCNHLLTWIRRAETEDELSSITYSAENLPEDLAENMNSILTTANSI